MNPLLLFTELALLKSFAGFVNASKVWYSIEGAKAAIFWLLMLLKTWAAFVFSGFELLERLSKQEA